MERDERNVTRCGTAPIQVSSPSSIWVSMNPATASNGQHAGQKIRSQAAKASAKARLRTISQKAEHRKPVEGKMVWVLPCQRSSPERRYRHLCSSSKHRSSPFGLLRKTPHVRDEVAHLPAHVQQRGCLNTLDNFPVHNDFTHLIDHFLEHFAPEPCEGRPLRGREAMRLELWPAMLQSAPLFNSMVLVLGTHYNLCVSTNTAAQNFDALRLRAAAISEIKSALAKRPRGFLHPCILGAIALLAGWELEFGDPSMYDLHMRFLQGVVQPSISGQAADDRLCDEYALPRVIRQLLANVGFELAVYASRQPYLSLPNTASGIVQEPSQGVAIWPSGFATALRQHIVVPRLLELLTRLGEPFDTSHQSMCSLSAIFKQVEAWDPYEATGSAYCFFQTQAEDDVNAQAHYSLRAAGLALCWLIRSALQSESPVSFDDFDWISGSGVFNSDLFIAQCSPWQPDALAGTVFEDITLWALFMTCLIVSDLDCSLRTGGRIRSMTARSAMRNGISNRTQMNDLLRRYVLPHCWLDCLDRCSTLLDELGIGQDGQMVPDVAGRLDGTTSLCHTPAARYDRRVHHPTTIVQPSETELCHQGAGSVRLKT